MKTCLCCGAELVRKMLSNGKLEQRRKFEARKFCSKICYYKYAVRDRSIRTCEECGSPFERKRAGKKNELEALSRFRFKKYCSHECSRKAFGKNNQIYSFEDVQKFASFFHGRLITRESQFKSAAQPMTFACKNGHKFKKMAHSFIPRLEGGKMKIHSFCPKCQILKKQKTSSGKYVPKKETQNAYFSQLENYIRERGGRFADEPAPYKNKRQKYSVFCASEHKFFMNLRRLDEGRWCPFCATVSRGGESPFRKNIPFHELREVLENTGMKLLSIQKVSQKPYLFQCPKNHIFFRWKHEFRKNPHCLICEGNKKSLRYHNVAKIEAELKRLKVFDDIKWNRETPTKG